VLLGGREVARLADLQGGAGEPIPGLLAALAVMRAAGPDAGVVIDADRGTNAMVTNRVLVTCGHAGLREIPFLRIQAPPAPALPPK